MKKAICIIIMFVFSTNSFAYEWFAPMTEREQTFQNINTVLLITDWMQTKSFRQNNRKERNPILGEEPTQDKIDIYFGTATSLYILTVYCLPEEGRTIRQILISMIFAIESLTVLNNCLQGYCPFGTEKINLNLSFKF